MVYGFYIRVHWCCYTKYRGQDQSSRYEERWESGGTNQVRTQKFLFGLGTGVADLKAIHHLLDFKNCVTKNCVVNIQCGSNMTGTDLCVNKPHCAAAVRP